MTTSPSLVQPIVLLVDKNDPAGHRDAIVAAARASTVAYAHALGGDTGPDPSWQQWLAGRFTKTVRRADLKTFAKLETSEALRPGSHVVVGKAQALAYSPVSYEEMVKPLARLQVSGTDLPDGPAPAASPASGPIPVIILNGDLGMSTGKSCAQAGHALFAWYLQERAAGLTPGEADLADVGLRIVGGHDFAELRYAAWGPVIVDSGLTEIDPDTATAFVVKSDQ